jgi:hypothetical protein
VALGVHRDVVDHAEVGDRPANFRIFNAMQRLTDLWH